VIVELIRAAAIVEEPSIQPNTFPIFDSTPKRRIKDSPLPAGLSQRGHYSRDEGCVNRFGKGKGKKVWGDLPAGLGMVFSPGRARDLCR
jgi:hypothetical protein